MCMGTPMTVVDGDEMSALCRRGDETRRISMALVGVQPAGAIVLVHLDTAVRVLESEEARQIDQALDGLAAALRGEPFEQHFVGLSGGMPLPPDGAASS